MSTPTPDRAAEARRLLDLLDGVKKDVEGQMGELSAFLRSGKKTEQEMKDEIDRVCTRAVRRLKTKVEAIRLFPVQSP
jgi:archaellum component FlaC